MVDRSKPERNYSAVPTMERYFRCGTVKYQDAILDKLSDSSTIGPKKRGRKNNPPKVTKWRTRDLAGVPDNVQSLTIEELQQLQAARQYFDHFDKGHKGYLDVADITASIEYLGFDCDDDCK